MSNKIAKILSIIITVFFGVFVLEGFGPGFGWQDSVSHLVPTLVLLLATITAWKKPRQGGYVFLILGIASLVIFKLEYPVGLTLSAVLFATSFLFLI